MGANNCPRKCDGWQPLLVLKSSAAQRRQKHPQTASRPTMVEDRRNENTRSRDEIAPLWANTRPPGQAAMRRQRQGLSLSTSHRTLRMHKLSRSRFDCVHERISWLPFLDLGQFRYCLPIPNIFIVLWNWYTWKLETKIQLRLARGTQRIPSGLSIYLFLFFQRR